MPSNPRKNSRSQKNSNSSRGRPRLPYEDASEKTKIRRITEIRSDCSEEQLLAASSYLKEKKQVNEVVENVDDTDVDDKALAMFMDIQLTKADYGNLRKHNENVCGDKIYPPYSCILQAKKRCYPENIEVTDRVASVDLQSLLNHTAYRLLLSLNEQTLDEFRDEDLTLDVKWGMDGASGQQTIKQKWHNDLTSNSRGEPNEDDVGDPSDESVFLVSIVPLQITAVDKIMWKNERPASARYCRPLKYEFTKETSENTLKEYQYYQHRIKQLQPFIVNISGRSFKFVYKMTCTMIDGKVCNILTEQAASNCCNICDARPSEVNDLEYVRNLNTKDEYFNLGLHPLHCRIRFLEHIWHLSCNLDFKEHQAKGINKEVKLAKKFILQKLLKSALGLTIDVVKRGYGTTNDGNTSRRFSASSKIVSEITEIDYNLLERYETILQVLNCGHNVDVRKFKTYADETAELYTKLYEWYPMPPSVHKVLIHGWRIIESLGLPIGCLSEEAQEANNKVFKKARANNSRMCSRQKCNEDVMHYLLISSDPYISSLRIKKEKKSQELSEDAQKLLKLQ